MGESLQVLQKIDKQSLTLDEADIIEVIARRDEFGKDFLQVNFADGRKILITESLIGFRPFQMLDLDMSKLPKVVTTPDIKSVFDALQEALQDHDDQDDDFEEIDVLRRVYEAVIMGGESVGFTLTNERYLLSCVPRTKVRATA